MRSIRHGKVATFSAIIALAISGCETTQQVSSGISNEVGGLFGGSAGGGCNSQRSSLQGDASFFGQVLGSGNSLLQSSNSILESAGSILGAFNGAGGRAGSSGLGGLNTTSRYLQALSGGDGSTNIFSVLSSLQADLTKENRQIGNFQSNFDGLIECRKAEAAKVRSDHRANKITTEQANQQLAVIDTQYREDVALGRQVTQNIDQRGNEIVAASTEVRAAAPVASSPTYVPQTVAYAPPVFEPTPQATYNPPVVSVTETRADLVTTSGVNVRSGPGTENGKIASIAAGGRVAGTGRSGNWWRVDLGGGRNGWISQDFLRPAPPVSSVPPSGSGQGAASAQEVERLALTNVAVRREARSSVESAASFGGFGSVQAS